MIITQYRPPHLGGRYALLIQMYVQMGVGHGDALLVEDVLDPLGQGEIHVPVILGLHPDAKGVGNGAVAVAAHAGAGGGCQEHIVHGSRQHQRVDDLLGGSVVGGGDGDIHPTGVGGGVVDDLRRDHGAVGNGNELVVKGGKAGVGHVDLLHRAGLPGDLHIVAGVEGVGGKNGEAADDVGEHILQGQGNGQGQDAGQGDDAGNVNVKAGGYAQTQQDIHGHLGERQNQAVGGLFQMGFFQSPLKQLRDDANDQKANDQHENGVEHLVQRAGSQSGKKIFQHGKQLLRCNN